ncbi:hypothetical protein JL721_11193 [Aureococcus anophagefferens]|nr:hypothetical protein JL721_11193 [Aureococcus anophagefferens]
MGAPARRRRGFCDGREDAVVAAAAEAAPLLKRGEAARVRAWTRGARGARDARRPRPRRGDAARVQIAAATKAAAAAGAAAAEAAGLVAAVAATSRTRTRRGSALALEPALDDADAACDAACDAARDAFEAAAAAAPPPAPAAAAPPAAAPRRRRRPAPRGAGPPDSGSRTRASRTRDSRIQASRRRSVVVVVAADDHAPADRPRVGPPADGVRGADDVAAGHGGALVVPAPPRGWESHFDEHYGLFYYFNTVSGETQWSRPRRAVGRYTSRWKPRWFVLEDSVLEYYDKRSQSDGGSGARRRAGGEKKVMRLDGGSVCSFTDTENCFCVETGGQRWFLVAPDEADLAAWIAALNAQIAAADDGAGPAAPRLRPPGPRTRRSTASPAPRRCPCGPTRRATRRSRARSSRGPLPGEPLRPRGRRHLRKGPTFDAAAADESAIAGERLPVDGAFAHEDDPAAGHDSGATFLKVADGRGWVPLVDPNTKRFLFEEE